MGRVRFFMMPDSTTRPRFHVVMKMNTVAATATAEELGGVRDGYLESNPEHTPLIEGIHDLELLRRDHALKVLHIENELAGAYLRQSFFASMGKSIEPAFMPLGWDWKITMAVLASFPAREVIIATMGTIYNLGADEDENSTPLIEKMRSAEY